MKGLVKKYPNITCYLLGLSLFGLALFVSVLVNHGIVKAYFPYTAVIALIIVTWLLYKREDKSLNEIGLNCNIKNLSYLPLGLFIAAGTFLFARYLRAIVLDETFLLASQVDFWSLFSAMYFILPTVAVEEFLFRGYLFKKTIELISATKANLLFCILFASIHVIDDQVLSNPPMIVMLAVSIPVGHLLFATALLKSKSIYFPIGLHLGNNWATRHLVSGSSEGNSIFYVSDPSTFDTWTSFIAFLILWNSIFLTLTYLIWKWDTFSFLRQNKRKITSLSNRK